MEYTLLSAMEHASAEDFARLEDVERKGLGTPATRAATIEKLVRSGFVERKKKQLIPTEKGMALVQVMPDQLKSAKLTTEWEDGWERWNAESCLRRNLWQELQKSCPLWYRHTWMRP